MEIDGMNIEWEKLKAVDIRTVQKEELVDIVPLLKEIPSGEGIDKKAEFLKRVKNPYCFRVGDIIVKYTFTEGATLKQRMQELIESM